MSGELIALGITLGVHILGAFALIAVLIRSSDADFSDWWPGDDDGGPPKWEPDPPRPSPSGDGLPLPDADPATVRLREPARLGDAYPRPARRRVHPQPAPQREPEPQP